MRLRLASLLGLTVGAAASGAFAADIPVKAPVYKAPAAIVASNWTGFYLGGYAGITASRSRSLDPNGPQVGDGFLEHTGYGFTGGGTVGYNYQIDQRWLVGVEGDIGYFDTSHRAVDWNDPGLTYNSKTSWLGTARGRIGWTNGPNLSYFTGGYAAVHFTDSLTDTISGSTVSSSKTKSGYAVGSGVETMLGGGWTAKSEFLYINVGAGDILNNTVNAFNVQTDRHRYYTQRFGINYLFGGKSGPLPQTNWSGPYAALLFGGAVSSIRGTGLDGTAADAGQIGNNGTGFTAGGQAGYNWMIASPVVVGVEGDISYLGVHHESDDFFNFLPPNTQTLNVRTSWIATARGRVGYSTGPALLYATGGAAWVNLKDTFSDGTVTTTSSKTLSGWAAGGGIETTLWGNWSTKTEYLFVDVGNGDPLADGGGDVITAKHNFHVFRSALVYRFNEEPIRARY